MIEKAFFGLFEDVAAPRRGRPILTSSTVSSLWLTRRFADDILLNLVHPLFVRLLRLPGGR